MAIPRSYLLPIFYREDSGNYNITFVDVVAIDSNGVIVEAGDPTSGVVYFEVHYEYCVRQLGFNMRIITDVNRYWAISESHLRDKPTRRLKCMKVRTIPCASQIKNAIRSTIGAMS